MSTTVAAAENFPLKILKFAHKTKGEGTCDQYRGSFQIIGKGWLKGCERMKMGGKGVECGT